MFYLYAYIIIIKVDILENILVILKCCDRKANFFVNFIITKSVTMSF